MSNKQLVKKYKNADVTFENGIPTSINVSVSMKLTTEPYENVSINAGLSLSLKDGESSIDEAYDEAWNYVLNQIVVKAVEIKEIYATEKMD